jgi:hypothetical protein
MGIVGRVTLALAICAAAGCSRSERGVQGRRVPQSVLAAKPKPAAAKRESIYDAQGNLKASSLSVGWLQIPEGLTARPSRDTQHVFSGRVPLRAVTRYLDACIFTANLQVDATSARYIAGHPKNLDKRALPLDVSVYTNPKGTYLDLIVVERTTNLGTAMTPAELQNLIQQKQARAE